MIIPVFSLVEAGSSRPACPEIAIQGADLVHQLQSKACSEQAAVLQEIVLAAQPSNRTRFMALRSSGEAIF